MYLYSIINRKYMQVLRKIKSWEPLKTSVFRGNFENAMF